jgi:hypothetical protein
MVAKIKINGEYNQLHQDKSSRSHSNYSKNKNKNNDSVSPQTLPNGSVRTSFDIACMEISHYRNAPEKKLTFL